MKGLLLKDIYQAWKYYKSFYFLMLVMGVASIWIGSNMFLAVYPFILSSMIPVNLPSVDESSKWEVFAGSLPCTRRQLVTVKYLLGLVVVLPNLVVAALCQSLRMDLAGAFSWGELGGILLVAISITVVLPALCLPFIFWLGTTKAKVARLFMVGALCGGAVAFGMTAQDGFLPFHGTGGIAAVMLGLAGLYLLSWYLAVRLYEKRDLG